MLLTRTPLYSPDCSRFLVRLACVRRAASVDSEPGSNSHLNLLSCIAPALLRVLTSSSLLHPTRLSKICAARPGIDNTANLLQASKLAPARQAPLAGTAADTEKILRNFKKSQTGRPYSAPRWPAQSFVTIPYRGSLLLYHIKGTQRASHRPFRRAKASKPPIGDELRISEPIEGMQASRN